MHYVPECYRLESCNIKVKMTSALNSICKSKDIVNHQKAIEDIAFICGGNLRKAILLLELLWSSDKLDDRKYLQELVNSTTNSSVQHALEEALRGESIYGDGKKLEGRTAEF